MNLLLLAVMQAVVTAPPPVADEFGEVTVVARSRRAQRDIDPVSHYRRMCYDPMRLRGAFAPPVADPDWVPLEPDERRHFGLTDADPVAYRRDDAAIGQVMFVAFRTVPRADGLHEQRCTIALIGGDAHDRLQSGISRVFGGSGTQRHVGARAGAPRIDGWRQHLWTAMPGRGSSAWIEQNARRRSGPPTWLVVTDLNFYRAHDYVFGDLKTRLGGDRRLSLLSLGYVSRPRQSAR